MRRSGRRARRQEKKERLLESAQHGEDGELMYEMEEGGMKEGSSTGESSDRDDSDDMTGLMRSEKVAPRRRWRRWVLIHSIIAIGFAILVLVAWKLSKSRSARSGTGGGPSVQPGFLSNGTALFAPTTIIVSLDGFRADFLQRGITPRLSAFVKEGVSPKYMRPSFPSVTFPNHYTLATGLYPESHGIVSNTFWDPELAAEFYYTDPARSLDPKWWGGEPFWVTAERQGVRSAIHMWPGSEAHVLSVEPSFMDKYNGKEALENKVARIMELLDKPGKEDATAAEEDTRPQLIAAYVPNVDGDGHKYGPNSTEIRATITKADTMLDQMFQGLEERNLTDIVNVIVVSDHGMATTDVSRLVQLEDLVGSFEIEHIDGWPLYGLRTKSQDDVKPLYDHLKTQEDGAPWKAYLRDHDMPERYHFSNNDRIAPLWIVPETGWAIVTKDEFDVVKGKEQGLVYHPRGLHGYDHEHPLMRAIFVARGPAFPHPANSEVDVFRKLYTLSCALQKKY
jgi:predicted AlkP superfamily pyrophosphatase or phosphodiesterase